MGWETDEGISPHPHSNSNILQSDICHLYQKQANVLGPKSPSTANCAHPVYSAPLFPCYSCSIRVSRVLYPEKGLASLSSFRAEENANNYSCF